MTEARRLVSREELALALHDCEWNCPADCGDDEAAAEKLHRKDADAIFAALPQPATEPALDGHALNPDHLDNPLRDAAQPSAEVERLRAANNGLREALRDACTLLPADRYPLLREATQRWYTMTDRDFRAAPSSGIERLRAIENAAQFWLGAEDGMADVLATPDLAGYDKAVERQAEAAIRLRAALAGSDRP